MPLLSIVLVDCMDGGGAGEGLLHLGGVIVGVRLAVELGMIVVWDSIAWRGVDYGLCMTLLNKACLEQLYCSCIIDTNIIYDLRFLIVSNYLGLGCFVRLQVNWLLDGKHPVCPSS